MSFTSLNQNKPKWLKATLTILIVATIVMVTLILILRALISVPNITQGINKYVSRTDENNQQTINALTNFNWSNFPTKLDNTEKQMLAALLLLYSEQTAVFFPEIQDFEINAADADELGLAPLPVEPNNKTLTKLIDQLIAVEGKYNSQGSVPAKTHTERLDALKKYLTKNSINSSYKIPDGAKDISESVSVASNHKDYAEKIILRYNNWLSTR